VDTSLDDPHDLQLVKELLACFHSIPSRECLGCPTIEQLQKKISVKFQIEFPESFYQLPVPSQAWQALVFVFDDFFVERKWRRIYYNLERKVPHPQEIDCLSDYSCSVGVYI
jgi:hypothetical protein